MKRKNIWITGCLWALPLMLPAQQSEPLTGPRRLFDDGKLLFQRHDYAAVRQMLSRYLEQRTEPGLVDEADYMLACTAYELKMPDCMARLEEYLQAHPESRYANRVRALIASACFFKGQYAEAIARFDACNLDALSDEEREECAMRLGTAYMKVGKLKEAGLWFKVLKEVSRKYHTDAVYNLAYIDYVHGRYAEALQGFKETEMDARYAPLAPYYMADIYLIEGEYAQARDMARRYLSVYPQQENALQMKRIAGEAAYGMKDYADAISSLEAYRIETQVPERKAMYKLGMAYFYTGVYSKAAGRLGAATGVKDALAQNASLHMGLAYLQLKDRNRARMAFEQASSTGFDRAVKEQALYNYALCIHETSYSPFAESVTVFERFLNEFPNSPYAEKVNNYLVEVYMNTRSYDAALRSIAKIRQPGERILEAKQKLLFRVGTQAFAQARFDQAANYFTQSLQLGRYNAKTKADAYYWRGEAKYRKEQYGAAAADYRQYLEFATDKHSEEYGLALYSLGYTAFKQKQYEQALTWFSRCVLAGAVKERKVVADAYNRMGDCNFYDRRFEKARELYAQAVNVDSSFGDYSLFQEAFVKGLQRNYIGKIESLNQLLATYPASQYIDDALYEQGRAYVQMEDNANAIGRYSLLVERYPDSPLARKAANEIGLLYYQDDRYAEAIAAYKKVIAKYPGSDEARLAQRDLKSVYVDLNKVDEYMAFASRLPGGGNLDAGERDSLTYTAAERVYMRGEIGKAREGFVRYLQSFPQGAFSLNASYYLGLIAYNQKQYAEASAYLDRVLEYPNSKFAAEALGMSAEIAFQEKQYEKAAGLYRQMAGRASSQEERVTAETGALRSACHTQDHATIIAAATELLGQSKLAPELVNEARYYRAKARMAAGQDTEALSDLTVLAKDTRNVYGAEAKYLVAQIYFNHGETDKAEKELLNYIEVSTPHAYWLARSFVLLSDVYVKMGRKLDARQYLLSLQQNYQADDDIAEMIKVRLDKLNTVK